MGTTLSQLLREYLKGMRQKSKRLAERYFLKFGNMSKIGKKPVDILEGVTVEIKEDYLEVKGPKATLTVPKLPGINVEIKEGQVVMVAKNDSKQTISNWGTMRALTQNAVFGSKEGYSKTRSEEHTSELQSQFHLVCRLLL